jgi:tetratricopeptide (TPR) repeat protein
VIQWPETTNPTVSEWTRIAEWIVVLGLAATLIWTTLCLGGYLAETMIVTSWAVFGLAALAAVLWAAGVGGRRLHLAALLPVPFLVYALASVWWLAPARWLAWREWLVWFQMWLVFATALHFGRNRAQTGVLVGVFVGLGLAGAGMAAYQRFVDPSWMMLGRTQADQFLGRSGGMFGVPNSLAGLLELMIPVCLVMLFSRTVRLSAKLLLAWLALLLVFAIVLTGSRGGWIGLGLALFVWPLLAVRGWKKKILGVGAVMLCVVVGLWGLYHESEYARERIQPFLDGRFEASRPLIWKAGWHMWMDVPWLGRGAASYNVYFDQYRPHGFLNEPVWAHNDYLNTLIDYGTAGFVFWLGAGVALGWAGWAAVKRAQKRAIATLPWHDSAKWKLGLFLGLVAYALHLGVDFHTKIPALAFLAAVVAALLIRDEPQWHRPVRSLPAWISSIVLATTVFALGARSTAWYRAEAVRFEARRSIDRYARTGEGNLGEIASAAQQALTRAVRLDPANGQAWADLSYATVQSWHAGKGSLVTLGRFAELAADEALAICPVDAEFWMRRAIALDIQRGRPETEECYRRATALAPNSRTTWYHYAYFLRAFPARRQEALDALNTCLALDPSYGPANILRQRLTATAN